MRKPGQMVVIGMFALLVLVAKSTSATRDSNQLHETVMNYPDDLVDDDLMHDIRGSDEVLGLLVSFSPDSSSNEEVALRLLENDSLLSSAGSSVPVIVIATGLVILTLSITAFVFIARRGPRAEDLPASANNLHHSTRGLSREQTHSSAPAAVAKMAHASKADALGSLDQNTHHVQRPAIDLKPKLGRLFAAFSTNGVMSEEQARSFFELKQNAASERGVNITWNEWKIELQKFGDTIDKGLPQYIFNVALKKDKDVDRILALFEANALKPVKTSTHPVQAEPTPMTPSPPTKPIEPTTPPLAAHQMAPRQLSSELFALFATSEGKLHEEQARQLFSLKEQAARARGETVDWNEWKTLLESLGETMNDGVRKYTFSVCMKSDPDLVMIHRLAKSPRPDETDSALHVTQI